MGPYSSLNTYHYEEKSFFRSAVDTLSKPLRMALGGRNVLPDAGVAAKPYGIFERVAWGAVALLFSPITVLSFAAKCLTNEKSEVVEKINNIAKAAGIMPDQAPPHIKDLRAVLSTQVNQHGSTIAAFLSDEVEEYYSSQRKEIEEDKNSSPVVKKEQTARLNNQILKAFENFKPLGDRADQTLVTVIMHEKGVIDKFPVNAKTFSVANLKSAVFVSTGILLESSPQDRNVSIGTDRTIRL